MLEFYSMKRFLDLQEKLKKSSHFLLGPRGTGKSYLIRKSLIKSAQIINLLDSKIYLLLQNSPSDLESIIQQTVVVIDEIQRIPELLNEVHRLIEEKNITFLLTGSSARKLRRNGVNLLAGRAFQARMFPLTWREIKTAGSFELDRYLQFGGLPSSYLNPENARDYLYAYIDTYLKEEIQAEAFVRNLAQYSRFLEASAYSSGKLINFTKIGNDAQISPNTVRDHYQLLEDTLLGFQLPAWTGSSKRKPIQTAKFYFFDIGVTLALLGVESLERASDLYGIAFEHFIAQEIRAYLSYSNKRDSFMFWRSKSNYEVDFLIGEETAIEVKASKKISQRDHKGLKALLEEGPRKHAFIVSTDKINQSFGKIQHIYWETFLENLWAGKYE